MIELVESLKNFPLECLREPSFLQVSPTSLGDLTGTLGLRLGYFPLMDNVVSLGEGESSPRGEGQLYIPAWLLVSLPHWLLCSPFR
jgi:hypothetical protein